MQSVPSPTTDTKFQQPQQLQFNTKEKVVTPQKTSPETIAALIKSNQSPAGLSPQLFKQLQDYIEDAFNSNVELSDEQMASVVNYFFTHHSTFSADLMAEVLDRLTESDTKQKFSSESIQKINAYVAAVFNSPEKHEINLITNAVDYTFITKAAIPDCAIKNVVGYVLQHKADFPDQSVADSASYILSNINDLTQCDASSIELFVKAINCLREEQNTEMLEKEVLLKTHEHAKNIISNFEKFDSKVITSAMAHLKAFQPKVWSGMVAMVVGAAKNIVDKNKSFFKAPLENEKAFVAFYEKDMHKEEAIGRYTKGMLKAFSLYPRQIIRIQHNQNRDNPQKSFFFTNNKTNKLFFTSTAKTTDNLKDFGKFSVQDLWMKGEFEAAIHANPILAFYIASKEKHPAMAYWNNRNFSQNG